MSPPTDPRSDTDLLAAIGDHDRDALHELYLRHHAWLRVRLAYRCADRNVVDEVVQDTFVKVWKLARTYDGRGDVAAWVWGIGVRTLLHAVRPRKSLVQRLAALRPSRAAEESAEEAVLLGLHYGDVGRALESLAPELRNVLQAVVLDGLTCEEAGRLLDIPTGTVKTRMMRAKRELREALL